MYISYYYVWIARDGFIMLMKVGYLNTELPDSS